MHRILYLAIVQCLFLSCPTFQPTVWNVFGDIAIKTNSVNLGNPDWHPPQFVLNSLSSASAHQYTRSAGLPSLVELFAIKYSRHVGRTIDGMNEIAITVGASQALDLTLRTLLQNDDEVIIFDPCFELYTKQIALTKAKPVFVPLQSTSNGWELDLDLLEKAITPRTKVLLLNSPHNPTGKVFTLTEMEAIADIVRRHPQLTVISDEVYKFTIYDPVDAGDSTATGHHHFARLEGMWDRTITISSCGKTFSVTGWQVGWMVAPAKYIQPVQSLLPCVQFCAATPIQQALVQAITVAEQPYLGYDSYYEWLRMQFVQKRAILEEGLVAAGIKPMPSRGGFFLMGQLPYEDLPYGDMYKMVQGDERVNGHLHQHEPYDWLYCRYLAQQVGVVAIPAGPFFSQPDYYKRAEKAMAGGQGPLARFAFCKKDETLNEAVRRLKSLSSLNRGQTRLELSPVTSAVSSTVHAGTSKIV